MSKAIPVSTLIDPAHAELPLEWVAGRAGAARTIRANPGDNPALTGFLNPLRPAQVVLLGAPEREHLETLSSEALAQACSNLCQPPVAALIITDGQSAPPPLSAAAEGCAVPLLRSPLPAQLLLQRLTDYFGEHFAERITLHGVFLEVLGTGVLLTGASGIGKSELALALIHRGHRLIADDAPEFSRSEGNPPIGRCPAILNDFLEVRGIGILNVRAIFGAVALRESHALELILHMAELDTETLRNMDRLNSLSREREILGVPIPEITLPVSPGRSLPVLVETAVQNEILKRNGYDAGADFIERQMRELERRA